ncbi:protein of unknown function [Saccharicrinis carchari]|uniref:eCIS core domain-containing protein n=1 Tax=Saccharicrinis carchari TaxID=1168039 RepID=A0A521CX08_SACCC|nr:DUF4157 domain-containing protein [Saccharicrinis carchari]SMO63979.1 protein of unknown function [Saccharicrinis carchari]
MFTSQNKLVESHSSSSANNHHAPFIQPRLQVGQPNHKYEVEAEHVADTLAGGMHSTDSFFNTSFFSKSTDQISTVQTLPEREQQEEDEVQEKPLREAGTPTIQSSSGDDQPQAQCEECEEEDGFLQAKATEGTSLAPSIEARLSNSSGSYLDTPIRHEMEAGFGTDFSKVKVYADSEAIQMNHELYAQAFSHGSDIYFNEGKYKPNSREGKHLLAHELTHTIQQGANVQPMIQKNGDETAEESSSGSSTPLADLIGGIVRDQLSNSSMKRHLSSLGTALQSLAVESATGEGDQPATSTERLAALGISGAFETTSAAILRDPEFAALRQQIINIIGGSDEAAFIAALAAGIAAVLADVPLSASPSQDLGAGFSVGGSFDLGSIQSLQFNEVQLYAQYASDYFRTRITGTLSRDDDTEEFSGSGTGEVRIGNDISHLMGRVTINSDGEVVFVGRLSAGHQFGGSDRLVLTTDLTHSFASGETIIQPGVSGRFNLGSDQSLRVGSSLSISTDSGLTGVTGFVEYNARFLQLRIEGNMTGISEEGGLIPGGDTRVQGMLTIPFGL